MPGIQIRSEITGSVWQIAAAAGEQLEEDDTLVVLESMKMEIPVLAPEAGKLVELAVSEGDAVAEGDLIAVLEVPA